SKIRLMRRLVRDMKFRQRSFAETVRMFRSVEEGENKYIMPFKYRSTYDVDTFMPYEVGAYRNLLLD
ncbi:MAG: nucleoside kinase, partial [Oscillospiraceae bacterium]|nr:nucleoside kinase [Oscillospiraceae bacterium]